MIHSNGAFLGTLQFVASWHAWHGLYGNQRHRVVKLSERNLFGNVTEISVLLTFNQGG